MKKMQNKVFRTVALILIVLVLLVGAAALVVAWQARQFKASGRIAERVQVAGVDLGGLDQSEALQKLQDQWLPQLPAQVTVKHEGETTDLDAADLGREPQLEVAVNRAMLVGRSGGLWEQLKTRLQLWRGAVEVPVEIHVDEARLQAAVTALATRLDREPVNARVTVTGTETVAVIPGKKGLKLDQKAARQALTRALTSLQTEPVDLALHAKEPAITAADLAHLEVVLGSYSTPYSAGKVDRTHNLKLAVEAVNGTVIMPGQVFSTDQTIGPRIAARGFREAPIFADGEVTPATGGGICQIASTIYNAALFADLPIVERRKHSQPVTYTPAGRDATVYSGQVDFRFRNDTRWPVVLLASMSGSKVHMRILGKKEANKKVRIERSGVTRVPFDTQEIPDPEIELGKKKVEKKGREGIRVTVYQIVTQPDGKEERRTLHTDVYRPQKQVVRVGTKKPVVPEGMKLMPDGKLVPLKPGEKSPAATAIDPKAKPGTGKPGTPPKPAPKAPASTKKPATSH